METLRVRGSELKVGDHIHVWWNLIDRGAKENRDIIQELKPYNGLLKHLWKGGAQLASFQFNRTGMTIDNNDFYMVDR
jgi:hypothetical protein